MALVFPSSPTDGQIYTDTTTGNRYAYRAAAGVWVYAANNVGMSVSSTPPGNVAPGAMWYNREIGRSFVYYDDGDSKQWVEVTPATGSFDSSTVAGYANAATQVAIVPAFNTANSGYASINSNWTVTNAVYGKANTALQNTSGTFAGALNVTGNVGIGNTAVYKLDVDVPTGGKVARFQASNTGDPYITVEDGTNIAYMFQNRGGYSGVGSLTGNGFSIRTNNTDRIYTDAIGNTGIGTTTPTFKFQVNAGPAYANGYSWFATNSGTGSPPNISFGLLIGTNYSGGQSETNLIWGQGISNNQYFAIGKTTGSAYTEQFRIDSSGRPLTPLRTAFYAFGTTGNFTSTNNCDLPFDSVRFNVGNCYNTSTYRFTAPVAGVYCFHWSGYQNGGAGRLSFKLNGASHNNQEMDAAATASQSMTTYLSAGDYITVGDWQSIAGIVIYMGHSQFSGHLVG